MGSPLTRALRVATVCVAIGVVTGLHHTIGLTNPTTAALSLLLVVLAVATLWGQLEAVAASFVAAACFNYFFLPPVGKWTIADPQNWVAFFSFLVVSIVAGTLSERARRKAREAVEHEQERARLAGLARAAEAARQSEEFKSTLLDALAHELKTPLTSLKASVSALRTNGATPSPAHGELLSIIEEETDRLNRLISETLHMARIEAGKLRVNRAPCDIESLINAAVEESRRLLQGRAVQVSVASSAPAVSADAELLRTVLRHLLDNAAKYSAPLSPIAITAANDGALVRVCVSSRGPSLSEPELSRIFERYYRSPQSAQAVPGEGLGLAIARDIVVAHGGHIWAESSPGQGTSITFSLPMGIDTPHRDAQGVARGSTE